MALTSDKCDGERAVEPRVDQILGAGMEEGAKWAATSRLVILVHHRDLQPARAGASHLLCQRNPHVIHISPLVEVEQEMRG
eukprot:1473111-Prymnesium_polylepis.1